jgi:hypothetical protein
VLVEDVLLKAGITEGLETGTSESEGTEVSISVSQETGEATGDSSSSSSLWRMANLEFSSDREDEGDGEAGLL